MRSCFYILALGFSLLTGCAQKAPESGKKGSTDEEEEEGDDGSPTKKTKGGGSTENASGQSSVPEEELARLFRDKPDFKKGDLDPITACDTLLKNVDLKDAVHPWPKKLKKMAIEALKVFPVQEEVLAAVHGFYMIDGEAIKGDLPNGAAGVACSRAKDAMGLILFDHTNFSGNYTPEDGAFHTSSDHVVNDIAGDLFIITFIHEMMHSIDRKHYQTLAGEFSRPRETLMTQSWTSFEDRKYKDISIFALADNAKPHVHRGLACSRGQWILPPEPAFALAASAQTDADGLEYLEKKTNHIAPYTMTNPLEDFAETLTIYYFGTRFDAWPSWKAYDVDLNEEAPEESKLLYSFETDKVIKTSKKHRTKMCKYAAQVFKEDCEDKLP